MKISKMTAFTLKPSALRCAASLFVLALSASGCEQPKPKCAIARGYFFARYTLVSGEGDCAQLTGEDLAVESYNGKGDRSPDYSKVTIAIQPAAISGLLAAGRSPQDPEGGELPYAIGPFNAGEPSADYCVAPTLSASHVKLAEVEEQLEMCPPIAAEPAVEVMYEFSNVRVYNTPSAFGTKFFADLTYTKDGCTAIYKVSAVYPSVPCGVDVAPPEEEMPAEETPEEEAEAGMPDEEPEEMDGGAEEEDAECPPPEEPEQFPEQVAEDALCSPVADPFAGVPMGSGINPDYAVRCDPEVLHCVLAEEPPPER